MALNLIKKDNAWFKQIYLIDSTSRKDMQYGHKNPYSAIFLKKVREEHGLFPYLNMAYDGQEQSNTHTRLEAFIHQAHQYMERELSKKPFSRLPH